VVIIERAAGSLRERLRGGVTLDNSGERSLGRTQLSANAAFDNPLGLNDIVTLSLNSNAEQPRSEHRSQSAAIGYSIPLGYSTFSLNRSHSRFAQNVQLTTTHVLSSGESDASELKWQHVAWRTASAKTSVHATLQTRRARSFLDDTENLVQRRRTTQFETGFGHRQLLGEAASVEFELGYRRGMPWLGAQEDFTAEAGGLTLRPRLWTLDAHYSHAFEVKQRPLQYSASLRAQHTRDTTLAIDQIGIGGRASVRGFDGDSVLLAESGWVLRNELSTPLALPAGLNGSAYLALDAGHVWGPSRAQLIGDKLAGTALGLRGRWKALQFDLALAAPLHKPHGFQTRAWSPYLSLTAAF
jgi:hemolysin activation/secretion protein